MNVYPAIDLKGGAAVRLRQGDMNAATVFNQDPAAQALSFVDVGARYLHLVDLDGAFSGRPENVDAVQSILRTVNIPIQLGGGIRHVDTIEKWLDLGIRRVILGTAAVNNPALVKSACKAFPGRILVGIDARAGRVAVEGWAQTSDLLAVDLAARFEDAGVAGIVFTDIDRDGMMRGVNWDAVGALADKVSLPIIASGGVQGMADLDALYKTAAATMGTIDGVIIGRALYDGAIDLREALKVAASPC